jgi:hypothetical protein
MSNKLSPLSTGSSNVINSSAPDISIHGTTVSLHPTGYSPSAHEQHLIDNMARFRRSPIDFLREISLYVSGTGWRSYDHVVGQKIFYAGFSERMKRMVLGDIRVTQCVKRLAEDRVRIEQEEGRFDSNKSSSVDGAGPSDKRKKEIEAQLREVADELVDNMICKMESNTFIRGAYYLATQLLTRAYHQGVLEPTNTRKYYRAYGGFQTLHFSELKRFANMI